jgi:hypothetical protein
MYLVITLSKAQGDVQETPTLPPPPVPTCLRAHKQARLHAHREACDVLT